MKKWIALLFMLALAGTLLPAVLPLDTKKIVLFSTTEEEQPDAKKEVKAKDVETSVWADPFHVLTYTCRNSSYPTILIVFSDDPYLDHRTPLPDVFC